MTSQSLITAKTDENFATCGLRGKIQYCKGDFAIFVHGLYIFGITNTL